MLSIEMCLMTQNTLTKRNDFLFFTVQIIIIVWDHGTVGKSQTAKESNVMESTEEKSTKSKQIYEYLDGRNNATIHQGKNCKIGNRVYYITG